MVTQFLILLGGIFAFLLLSRAIFGKTDRLYLTDAVLAGSAGLVLLAALIVDSVDEAVFDAEELAVAGIAVVLILGGLALMLMARRGSRITFARGAINLSLGIPLLLLTVIIPAISARIALPEQIEALPTPTPGTEQTMNQRARGIFDTVVEIIAGQTGLDEETVTLNLDNGITVGEMVRDNGGDLEVIITQISEVLSDQVRMLTSEERLNSTQAAFLLSQMENIVRVGVEQDLTGALARFDPPPPPES